MTRRALVVTALVVAFAPGCAWLKGFAKKPGVKLEKVEMQGIDFQEVRLRAELLVENRVSVPVKLARVTWGVTIDGDTLASGEAADVLEVPGNGTAPVQIPFALKFEELYRVSQKYKDQDEAPYRFQGTLAVETPVGPVTLPFRHDGKVPVLKLPQVELTKADVRGLSFSGADVRFKFNIKNPNKFALDVQELDYELVLAGTKILDGKLPAPLSVAPKAAGVFDAEVRVSFAQAKAAAQVIAGNGNAEYLLSGNLSAGTPWGAVHSPYARSGTIKIQK